MALNEQKRRVAAKEALSLKSQSAFTLVELLVVIAMITVLVGVFAPVAIQSRNKARAATCLSNLRQLSSAIFTYSQDWSERLPVLSSTQFAGSFASNQWPDGSCATQLRCIISKYVKNGSVYRCGNDTGSPEFGFDSTAGTVFSRTGSSYLPWSASSSGLYGVQINGERVSSYISASGYCILRDYGSDWHGYRKRSGFDIEATTVANAAYADGHVGAIPIYLAAVADRRYACYSSSRDDAIFISGGSGDAQVELSGRRKMTTSGPPRMHMRVSGTVGAGQNINHVFTFSSTTKMDAAFRQISAWADSRASR